MPDARSAAGSAGRARLRRYPLTALGIALVLVIGAIAWLLVAVPMLVKYPTDVDASPRYAGTFRLLVNPATAAPLDQAIEQPLAVERHIQARSDQSTSSQVVVGETITQRAGPILDTTQVNQYVMDRSTNQNVADPRAFAFTPTNVVDRSGAYRLNLPFETPADGDLAIYKNEIGSTYTISPDGQNPTSDVEGLSVLNFNGSMTDAPVTPAYLAELGKSAPLPSSLTLEQIKPHLLAAGLDVDALLTALGPRLTPADGATLAAFAGNPIPLDYVMSFDGSAAVEPVTGAEVKVGSFEAIGVRPQASALPALDEVLSHYGDVPEAVAARGALNRIATGPAIRLIEYSFEQTPASVAEIAGVVSSQRRQIQLARDWIPAALIAGAILSLAIGTLVMFRRVPSSEPLDLTGLTIPEPATEPALDVRQQAVAQDDGQELTSRPESRPR